MKGKKFPLKIKRGNTSVTVYKNRIGESIVARDGEIRDLGILDQIRA